MHLTVEGFLLFKQSLSKFSFFVIRDPTYESKENKENQWNVEFVNHSPDTYNNVSRHVNLQAHLAKMHLEYCDCVIYVNLYCTSVYVPRPPQKFHYFDSG